MLTGKTELYPLIFVEVSTCQNNLIKNKLSILQVCKESTIQILKGILRDNTGISPPDFAYVSMPTSGAAAQGRVRVNLTTKISRWSFDGLSERNAPTGGVAVLVNERSPRRVKVVRYGEVEQHAPTVRSFRYQHARDEILRDE